MNLPEDAKMLISVLQASGYKAYAVGGCVRDALMDIEPKDIDITTSARPEEMEAVFNESCIRYVETGIKHGTITAIVNSVTYEVTTFRVDGEYIDNRHPENVKYVTDVEDDLSRRDFTINAMAYNDSEGLIDAFDGKADLDNRIIRAVGDPNKRFQEDALRIMRALRFSSTLGFEIEDNTSRAILDNKDLLKNIANERIYTELIKLLLGDNCESVLNKYRDVIAVIIPELSPCFDYPQNSKWHIYDVYSHTVKSLAISPKVDYIRLALLLHDIGKPDVKKTDIYGQDHFKGHPSVSLEYSKGILKRLRSSNDVYSKVTKLVEIHDKHITTDPANVKMWLRILGEDLIYDFIDVKIADMKTHNPVLVQEELNGLYCSREMIGEILEGKEPYKISDLKINGNDLASLGYKGAEIANMLEFLIEQVSIDQNFNTKDNLLLIASKQKNKA